MILPPFSFSSSRALFFPFGPLFLLAAVLLSGQCRGFSYPDTVLRQPYTEREIQIHWNEIHAFFPLTRSEYDHILAETSLSRNDLTYAGTYEGESIYRTAAENRFLIRDLDYRPLRYPPFSIIDVFSSSPASPFTIEERRNSRNPADWWNGYKDEILSEKILHAMARQHPDYTRLYVIGRSVRGRPIYALRIQSDPTAHPDKPSFLFSAAMHGNELLAIDFVLDVARLLLSADPTVDPSAATTLNPGTVENNDALDLNGLNGPTIRKADLLYYLENYDIWILPALNPDGVHFFWNHSVAGGRKNARNTTGGTWTARDGVDLNRNYPFQWNSASHRNASSGNPASVFYRGPKAASEPETQAFMALAEKHRFVMALSYHTFATRILVPYTIDGIVNPRPSRSFDIGRQLARAGDSKRSDRIYEANRNLYPVDGTDQDWLYHQYGTQAFTVEGSMQNPDYDMAQQSIHGMRPVSFEALAAFRNGPILTVHTYAEGQPVSANIEILEHTYFEGEQQRTHPPTGRYDFFIESGAELTISVERNGVEATQKVQCRNHCQISFDLTENR